MEIVILLSRIETYNSKSRNGSQICRTTSMGTKVSQIVCVSMVCGSILLPVKETIFERDGSENTMGILFWLEKKVIGIGRHSSMTILHFWIILFPKIHSIGVAMKTHACDAIVFISIRLISGSPCSSIYDDLLGASLPFDGTVRNDFGNRSLLYSLL